MDFTHDHTPLKSKLPIKRKTLFHPSSSSSPNYPHFSDHPSSAAVDAAPMPPPFKFHRIWTESDEIRFLQGLLNSASHGLVFPRDLHIFSDTMSQPYTKSQLSEKLRRLRKKFQVISSRLARGLDLSMLSPHDRALYDLSKKLWSPDSCSVSPFVGNPGMIKVEDDSIGDPSSDRANQNVDGDGKLGKVAAKTVLEVFDQCVGDARMFLHRTLSHSASISAKEGDGINLGKRWEEQQASELDVFARRLKLVLEFSSSPELNQPTSKSVKKLRT